MIIVYILAVIGGFCVLGIAGLMVLIAISSREDRQEDKPEEQLHCGLMDRPCIYTANAHTYCIDCPIAEEAERKEAERRERSNSDR